MDEKQYVLLDKSPCEVELGDYVRVVGTENFDGESKELQVTKVIESKTSYLSNGNVAKFYSKELYVSDGGVLLI